MITPENYYLKYKKITTLFNEKLIFIIISLLYLLMLLAFYEFMISQLSITFFAYFISAILIFFKSRNIIKSKKIDNLIKLTNNKNIKTENFHEEFDKYIIKELDNILKENYITAEIYKTFYRHHLNNYLQSSKNIFGENAYISFIGGTIYASFLQKLLSMANNNNDFFFTLIIIITFSVVIIFIIKQIKQESYNKYEQIYNLIFYTEIIFSKYESRQQDIANSNI